MPRLPYQIKLDGNVYNRGTLAQLLDLRNIVIGEPKITDLPKTVNPLQFLCNNLIVNNGFVVKIKQDAIQVDNEYIKLLSDLQYVIPPEKSVLLCIELSEQVDIMDINDTEEEVNILDATDANDVMTEVFSEYVGIAYNRDECDA